MNGTEFMRRAWMKDNLIHPDQVGSSTYRAVYDTVQDAVVSAETFMDLRGVAINEAARVIEDAQAIIRRLTGVEK